jgi:hypothetical protein
MDVVLRLTGVLLVLMVLQDVFFTVLFPASQRGLIRRPLSTGIWHIFRFLGGTTSGQRRRDLLSYSGPVLIAAALVVWLLLLVSGWAMIYKPALGTGIRSASGATDTGWATAFYYSGFNLTTLGLGDLSPTTGAYRLLTVIEAALGFTFFSMVITYFLSVYSNLTSRNAFAQGLHYRTRSTGDAAELLAGLADGSELPDARQHLESMADFLRQIYQTHRFYPVLRYFHYREPYYELPRVLLIVLDAATLLRSGLDQERYAGVIHSSARDELCEAALVLMHELIPDVQSVPPSAEEAAMWRERYTAAVDRLNAAGLHVRTDAAAGADEYVALRTEWHRSVQELAVLMLYEWTDEASAVSQIQRAPKG